MEEKNRSVTCRSNRKLSLELLHKLSLLGVDKWERRGKEKDGETWEEDKEELRKLLNDDERGVQTIAKCYQHTSHFNRVVWDIIRGGDEPLKWEKWSCLIMTTVHNLSCLPIKKANFLFVYYRTWMRISWTSLKNTVLFNPGYWENIPMEPFMQNDITLLLTCFATLKVKCLVSDAKSTFGFTLNRWMWIW